MPLKLVHIGNHIRLARYRRRLTPGEAAEQIGTKSLNLILWEQGNTEPPVGSIPNILRFLGYDPLPPPRTNLPERLFAFRRVLGLDRKQAGHLYGVGERTWGDWELGHHAPFPGQAAHLENFLEAHHAKAAREWAGVRPFDASGIPACFRVIQGRIVHTGAILTASRRRWEREKR